MLPGLLLMLPVVVVDVDGDRLDPSHTRELVAKELSVDAVAPDDPRAADATSRIEVKGNAKDGSLVVRYRKLDEPIERKIALASDPNRADNDAALLAGNLARDEASELTPDTSAKPAEPAPQKEAPRPYWDEDDHRYAQLRAYVTDLSNEARATSFRSGVLLSSIGVLMLTPGIYISARGELDSPHEGGLALASFINGGVFIAIGTAAMIVKADPYEPLARVVREQDANKVSSEDALANVETEWKKQVEAEQSARQTSAILSFVLAGASIGTSTVLLATDSSGSPGMGVYFMASGAACLLTGIASLLMEGPMERAHRQWQSVSTAGAPSVGFGIGPLAGGGAGSFAVRF